MSAIHLRGIAIEGALHAEPLGEQFDGKQPSDRCPFACRRNSRPACPKSSIKEFTGLAAS